MKVKFSPIYGDVHPFEKRRFGKNLVKVTEEDPSNPSDAAKKLTSLSKKQLEKLCNKHKVLHELPMNNPQESLPNIIDAVLNHFEETGILKNIILPFIEEKSPLQEPDELLYPIDRVFLNYGPDGKGGQRNPKPRHVLEMMRKFNIKLLTVGMARRNSTGQVFVNEGQQRSIAAGILGKSKMCYQCLVSDDEADDPIAYKGENSGKLSQSDVETYESDAIIAKNALEKYLLKNGRGVHTDLDFASVQRILNVGPEQDEFVHYKMKRILYWNRRSVQQIHLVNSDADSKTRFATNHCGNYSQTWDIFETDEYTDNNDRVLKSALDFYQRVWSKRAMVTGDLIMFLEFFYFNQDWFYDLDENEQEYFLIRMKNAIQPIWVDNETGNKGAGNRAVWDVIQDARSACYPFKTVADKQANSIYYSAASPRVAQCMWIGTALYHLLKERMDEDDVKLLVQPSVLTEDGTKLVYDKLAIVPKAKEKKPAKANLKALKKA
jgi:hypothetical protein